jgi:hypothetical protein
MAATVQGFVQQLACAYLPHGYWFHVPGRVPATKDPRSVDAKLVSRYGIDISKWARTRRKRSGYANVHYIRHDRFFVLLATHGQHRFFDEEGTQVRDIRRSPLRFAGYAISHRSGHSHVRIEADTYRDLKAVFLDMATRRTIDEMALAFRTLPYEPYAPVRRQLLNLWRQVNVARKTAAMQPLPIDCLRLRRHILKPFLSTPTDGEPHAGA